jgi:hypothetical protein
MAKDDFYKDKNLSDLLARVLRRKGVAEADVLDARQDVLVALLIWSRKNAVESEAELTAGARVIALNVSKKYHRRRAVRRKRDAGVTGEADAHAPLEGLSAVDPVDAAKALDAIGLMIAEGKLSPKAAAVLTAFADNQTLAEFAEESQQDYAAVRQMHARATAKVVLWLLDHGLADVGVGKLYVAANSLQMAAAGAVAIVLFFVSGVGGGLLPPQPIAHHPVVPVEADAGTAAPVKSPEEVLAETQAKREQARAAIQRAAIAYKRHEWRKCLQEMSGARALDPDAGNDEALRNACAVEEDRESNSKGGGR